MTRGRRAFEGAERLLPAEFAAEAERLYAEREAREADAIEQVEANSVAPDIHEIFRPREGAVAFEPLTEPYSIDSWNRVYQLMTTWRRIAHAAISAMFDKQQQIEGLGKQLSALRTELRRCRTRGTV